MTNMEQIRKEDGYVFYRTSCECMSPEHVLTMNIEKGKGDNPLYLMSLYYRLVILPRNFLQRIKEAWKILTTGILEYEDEFTFRGREHIRSFANTILVETDKQDYSEPVKIIRSLNNPKRRKK